MTDLQGFFFQGFCFWCSTYYSMSYLKFHLWPPSLFLSFVSVYVRNEKNAESAGDVNGCFLTWSQAADM